MLCVLWRYYLLRMRSLAHRAVVSFVLTSESRGSNFHVLPETSSGGGMIDNAAKDR